MMEIRYDRSIAWVGQPCMRQNKRPLHFPLFQNVLLWERGCNSLSLQIISLQFTNQFSGGQQRILLSPRCHLNF